MLEIFRQNDNEHRISLPENFGDPIAYQLS